MTRIRRDGRSRNPLYTTWCGMRRRCHDPSAHNYAHYGARGIEVFEPWRQEGCFWAFADYIEKELGPRVPGMTLDRIDVNGNYEPGNLRWADHFTQMGNRTDSVVVRVGERYGLLVVLELTRGTDPRRSLAARCVCDCDAETVVRRDGLVRGTTRSCGCLQRATASQRWIIPPDVQHRVQELHADGLSFRSIGRELGIDRHRAAKIVAAVEAGLNAA